MRTYRCPECRTRRKDFDLFMRHIHESGHALCNCGHVSYGGTGFPHRPGSPCCIHNPLSALWIAMRQGEGPEVLQEVAAWLVKTQPETASKVRALCAAWGVIDSHVN